MHSKLKSSSQVSIQIGLFTLVELDYVETDPAYLSVFSKVLALAEPQGLVGGYKNFMKDGNTIGLQRLNNSCKQANKKQ
jgi:hypothetical protein